MKLAGDGRNRDRCKLRDGELTHEPVWVATLGSRKMMITSPLVVVERVWEPKLIPLVFADTTFLPSISLRHCPPSRTTSRQTVAFYYVMLSVEVHLPYLGYGLLRT